ncbi:selenocysteine lyase isoform X1 [Accipiter gentilis]|uniref:selenocysteine lyase isoform X1 n=1 Tax=Astur gentilis TaxID=8957 RepID=UPI002110AB14|nr:selenocysteine lyase isoform X1 [Accipiter gentilis]
MGAGTEPAEARRDAAEGRIYLDHNATTPLAPEAAQAVRDAMLQAWGNPSSSHPAGRKAKELIGCARESLARMVGGRPEDIVFTSGGTEANNMVIHTARRHFCESQARPGDGRGTPHIVTSSVEHDSIRLPLEQLVKESLAEATFVAVSPQSGRAEVDDVLAAIRPTTCLVSIMLANNETGVIMPVTELSQRVHVLNQWRVAEGLPRILVHTDAAQMIGKGRVDVQELGVDYLTIVGHKFYGPRIGALYVRGPGTTTPLHPMLFGGGQERSFRPGTENTPMIAGLGQAAELVSKNWEAYKAHMQDVRDYLEARLEASFGKQRIHLNSHFTGSKRLCNTSNFSILGPGLQGRRVLSRCKMLLASVGAACHSEKGDRMVETSFRKSGCIERILLCFRVDLLSITDLIVLGDLSFTAVAQLEIQFLGHSSPHRRSGLPASIQTDIWPQSTKSFTDFFFVHTGDANFSHRTISITSFRILQPKHKKCYRG